MMAACNRHIGRREATVEPQRSLVDETPRVKSREVNSAAAARKVGQIARWWL
jgi:hypothetical protein